jgi:MGT family glycosyltransferase
MGTVEGGFEMLRSAYRTILDALVDLPARVLLTVGGDLALESLGEVPAHVHVERFVPQDEVLPHAAAVVCHGGSGTMLGAAAAGVPLVVTPMFADQPFNAERAVAAGSALALPTRELATAPLREILTRVLAEPSFRVAAQRIAAEIAALPSIDEAAVAIERMARS